MTFGDKQWNERLPIMGDVAEAQFMAYAASKGWLIYRYGLERPPFKRLWEVSPIIRATPDFLVEGSKAPFFVECKGTGGRVLKLKEEALEHLRPWLSHHRVYFFLYDSTHKRGALIEFGEMLEQTFDAPIKHFESDKKSYYEIPCERFTWFDLTEEFTDD